MHGRKRAEYKARLSDPKTASALSQKALQWHALVQELGQRRSNQDDEHVKTLKLLEKALLVNPDPTYLWNHRRELLLNKPQETDFLSTELALTQAALERNPKAYGAWFHRKWTLQNVKPSESVLQGELKLTTQFLKADERNFHGWNFRRFVVACLCGNWSGCWETPKMGHQIAIAPSDKTSSLCSTSAWIKHEWDFTLEKIQNNFSNFSAFHYRSQLLPDMLQVNPEGKEEFWETEMTLIEDAVCTEPDDQTAWWYHALLLDHHYRDECGLSPERLEAQADLMRELLEEVKDEGGGKWILLGLHRVLTVLGRDDSMDERQSLLTQLMTVDVDRRERYQSLLKALHQEPSS